MLILFGGPVVAAVAASAVGYEPFSLERTEDVELVRRIVCHPGLRDELFQAGEEPQIPIHPQVPYLVAREMRFADGAVDDCIVGLAAFHPVNAITWTPHLAILPEHRGKGSDVLKAAMRWMAANTPCRKLFAAPPAFKVAMIRCFEKCGFRREGLSPASFLWKGEIHDRVLMGKEIL